MVKKLSALEVKEKLQQNPSVLLLDVREQNEFNYANIAGSILIPMRQIPERIGELDQNQEIVVICHHGMRSLQVSEYLISKGFSNIFNLNGGIDAWARECDSSVLRY